MTTSLSLSYRKTWDALMHARSIGVLIPGTPDGDNVGSALGLAHALTLFGKDARVVSLGHFPEEWYFLPGSATVVRDPFSLAPDVFDVLVVTDVSDPMYAGIIPFHTRCVPRPLLVQIDHHATNTFFGDVNCVDVSAASATTVVATLLEYAACTLTPSIAVCLLTGLLTDTSFFSNPATDSRALALGARLIEHGANIRPFFRSLVQNKNLATLKVWGCMFERMQLHASGLAVTFLAHREVTEMDGTPEAAEGLANFLNILSGVRAVCILREEKPGMIKCSLRTTRPDVDVSRIALLFGGGGHKKAAGFSMAGRFVEKGGRWGVEV